MTLFNDYLFWSQLNMQYSKLVDNKNYIIKTTATWSCFLYCSKQWNMYDKNHTDYEILWSFTSTRNLQSSLKGSTRLSSLIFLMTSTLTGGLFQVSRWLAGSWMCLGHRKQTHEWVNKESKYLIHILYVRNTETAKILQYWRVDC